MTEQETEALLNRLHTFLQNLEFLTRSGNNPAREVLNYPCRYARECCQYEEWGMCAGSKSHFLFTGYVYIVGY